MELDLAAIRRRVEVSAKAIVDDPSAPARDRLTIDQVVSRWYHSAQDVAGLLELVQAQQHTLEHEREKTKALKDSVRILVVAARNWAYSGVRNEGELALIRAVDMMPWTVLDDLGIPRDES